MDWSGKRVLLMGLGRFGGGVGAARYLAARGAHLTITDTAAADDLSDSIAALADVPVAAWRLGEHRRDDFTAAETLIVNPAVRPDHPLIEAARRAGAAVTTEIQLLLDVCPQTVVAATGSNGKSTTAALVAAALSAAGRRVWLGGNIGGSLLGDVERMQAGDVLVLELSSFQLHWLPAEGRPIAQVAAVTNCSPNHLDWHGNWAAYVAAKRRLIAGPRAAPVVALNDRDAEVGRWRGLIAGRCVLPLDGSSLGPLRLLGQHNRDNAALAASVARELGADVSRALDAIQKFPGLPHRLEFLGETNGRAFYNDSKATTPQAATAAMRSLESPVWLLAGGVDKGGDFSEFVRVAATRARGVACFGRSGPTLADRFTAAGGPCQVSCADTMREALAWCWSNSAAGEAIVLSPACASFDQFRNYEHRGEVFRQLAAEFGVRTGSLRGPTAAGFACLGRGAQLG